MPTIAIIGGGFAGATLARALAGRLPSSWQTLLTAEESFTTYNPLLPDVIGASLLPETAVAPLRQVMAVGRNRRFLAGVVTRIDPGRRTLSCFTLAGEQELGFDHLVLAMGNRARMDLIPGTAAHALPLKSVGDALHIRNVVLRRLAMMELATDAAERARLGHFVVIGGGFSGVEVAGALLDCLGGIARIYPLAPPACASRWCTIWRRCCPKCRRRWGARPLPCWPGAVPVCGWRQARLPSMHRACFLPMARTLPLPR